MQSMKEEMDRLRSLAGDREQLSMTTQSMEDSLKKKETEVSLASGLHRIPSSTRKLTLSYVRHRNTL